MLTALEWIGCALGLVGAFLLATNSRFSKFGWLAFFAANVAMIGLALGIERNGLLVQQLGFLATSCLGIYRAPWKTA
ncbi:MAG: hypothetical protein EOO81_02240 [Oxalobacteraceae bacterium]|nr:MAG: hypothetical protein EOO81_02240 [Oxalobacteraceae bacterium]